LKKIETSQAPRKYIGVEIAYEYVELAEARIKDFLKHQMDTCKSISQEKDSYYLF
jgi:DNA modification methylase